MMSVDRREEMGIINLRIGQRRTWSCMRATSDTACMRPIAGIITRRVR